MRNPFSSSDTGSNLMDTEIVMCPESDIGGQNNLGDLNHNFQFRQEYVFVAGRNL